jgi:hypothetical protein
LDLINIVLSPNLLGEFCIAENLEKSGARRVVTHVINKKILSVIQFSLLSVRIETTCLMSDGSWGKAPPFLDLRFSLLWARSRRLMVRIFSEGPGELPGNSSD